MWNLLILCFARYSIVTAAILLGEVVLFILGVVWEKQENIPEVQ